MITVLLVAGAALLLAYLAAVLGLLIAGRRTDARALAGFVPDCIVLVRRLLADPELPRSRRVLLVCLLVYLFVPIDLVPDFIPVVGQLDDAIVVGLALRLLVRSLPAAHVARAWPGPESSLRLVLRAAGMHRPGAARNEVSEPLRATLR